MKQLAATLPALLVCEARIGLSKVRYQNLLPVPPTSHPPSPLVLSPEWLLSASILSLLILLPPISLSPFIPSQSSLPSSNARYRLPGSGAARSPRSHWLVSADWHAQCVSRTDLPACVALPIKIPVPDPQWRERSRGQPGSLASLSPCLPNEEDACWVHY